MAVSWADGKPRSALTAARSRKSRAASFPLPFVLTSHITSHIINTGVRMSKIWPVQDAKARFSELLETSLREGPQVVTRRGVETAVLVPIEQWRSLEAGARPNLKALLLATEPRTETLTPKRSHHRRRPAPAFD